MRSILQLDAAVLLSVTIVFLADERFSLAKLASEIKLIDLVGYHLNYHHVIKAYKKRLMMNSNLLKFIINLCYYSKIL
jgi:hypothetical protein